jgi:hypothetical protein
LKERVTFDESTDFIKGIRVGNNSAKIYQYEGNKYLVILKKYIFGFCYSTQEIIVDDYFTAEDYIRNLKK